MLMYNKCVNKLDTCISLLETNNVYATILWSSLEREICGLTWFC